MSAVAGRISRIEVSDDLGVSWENLGNLVEATFNLNVDELECTTHDSNGAREYIPNHHDAEITGQLRWDQDNLGQGIVLDAAFAKTVFMVRFRIEVGTGRLEFVADGFATTYSPSTPLDDTANIDFTLRLSGVVKQNQA